MDNHYRKKVDGEHNLRSVNWLKKTDERVVDVEYLPSG